MIDLYTTDKFKASLEPTGPDDDQWILHVKAPTLGYTKSMPVTAPAAKAVNIAWKLVKEQAESIYREALVIYQNISPKV